jgi:hypothetical protein
MPGMTGVDDKDDKTGGIWYLWNITSRIFCHETAGRNGQVSGAIDAQQIDSSTFERGS